MAIQKASSRTIDGFQTKNQEDYSDTTTMEVQAVRLALPGFYTRLRHMWLFSNHQVGQVGFLRVLRFPPTKKHWQRNDDSLFHNRCLINYIFLLEVYCFYVWSTLSWSCYFCMDFCCTYVCGFGFNTTMVELIESGLNHKLVFIMETLLYMYVWSCGDLFWYTLDSKIFINWTNQ